MCRRFNINRSGQKKYDLILALLKERSNGEKAAQVIQINNQPSGSQGAADSVEVVAEASNIVRKPSSNSASEYDDVSDDEGPMDVGDDVLSNLVQAQGLEQAGLAAMDALRAEDLNTPPLAHIDETLHRQVEDEARLCDGFIGEQEGEAVNHVM